jgi:hypothetical protein
MRRGPVEEWFLFENEGKGKNKLPIRQEKLQI